MNKAIKIYYPIAFQLKENRNRTFGSSALFLILFVVLLSSAGCKKWLEIEPAGEVIQENFWKNEGQVEAIVAGCYKSLTEDDVMSRIILWGEGRSDNVISNINSYDFNHLVNLDLDPTNSLVTWGPFYKTINYCNTFLAKAPEVMTLDGNFTKGDYMKLESEVLSIRALTYFYLVRAFRNVPWVDKPSLTDQQDFNIPQSSDTVVLGHIISDLQYALINAPDEYLTPQHNKGRFTKTSIMALLADVYLWNKQYLQCVDMCNQIINSGKYMLIENTDFRRLMFYFNNSEESIFEMQFGEPTLSQQPNNIVRAYYNPQYIAELVFSSFLIPGTTKSPFKLSVGSTIESEDDLRYKEFVDSKTSSVNYYIFKYTGNNRSEDVNGVTTNYYYNYFMPNWIVYRLADIILMKAEALVQLNRDQNDLQEAMDMVNLTYLRANPKLAGDPLKLENYPSQGDMARLVLRERQRELMFEGKRYYDLMRYAIRENTPNVLVAFITEKLASNTTQIGPNSIIDALYLPVNQGVLAKNPKLKQNPYYITEADKANSTN